MCPCGRSARCRQIRQKHKEADITLDALEQFRPTKPIERQVPLRGFHDGSSATRLSKSRIGIHDGCANTGIHIDTSDDESSAVEPSQQIIHRHGCLRGD
jgi:hypothetical protein